MRLTPGNYLTKAIKNERKREKKKRKQRKREKKIK
jgi:hypothetical protein